MKTLERNKTIVHYCLYKEKRAVVDEYGNRTGEYIVLYEDPVELKINVSSATGRSQREQFGNIQNYDKVLVTDWMNCPVDENTVLFIDKAMAYTTARTYVEQDGTHTVEVVDVPVPDYLVSRVSKSLNSVSIAVRKIT